MILDEPKPPADQRGKIFGLRFLLSWTFRSWLLGPAERDHGHSFRYKMADRLKGN
jgi:hypothetical protein